MTTHVTVEARCDEKTHVLVKVNAPDGASNAVLEDGDEASFDIHDDMSIVVKEAAKA